MLRRLFPLLPLFERSAIGGDVFCFHVVVQARIVDHREDVGIDLLSFSATARHSSSRGNASASRPTLSKLEASSAKRYTVSGSWAPAWLFGVRTLLAAV